MQFVTTLLAALSASVAVANTVIFHNVDSTERTIYFTPNSGLAAIPKITIPGNSQATTTFPKAWIGNWFSISKGAPYKPGMLGEIAFDQWGGKTYFDVSAIVDGTDVNGVKWMYPAVGTKPTSGCDTFPCNNVYNVWNDVQTKVTEESDIICILGTAPTSPARRHAREFVNMIKKAVTAEYVSAQQNFPRKFVTESTIA